jgi:protein tyrosine/serine phosphatase
MMSVNGKPSRSVRRRILPVLLIAFVIGALCAGGAYGYWAIFGHRFSVVAEGKLYQSGEMPTDDLMETVREHGIRTIVDLRRIEDKVLAEHAALDQAGIRHVDLPSSQVPEYEAIDKFLEIMDDPAYRPVLIHCEDGEGRSVLFAAIYRIEFEGWSNERAQRATRLLPYKGSFSEGRRKGDFLLNYEPRRNAPAGNAN